MALRVVPALVRPYTALARAYDGALGIPAFVRIRAAFESLVARYGISFGSAADVGCGTGLFACYLRCCWGVPVVAVDRSRAMLEQAKRNCAGLDVCFLEQDIRMLELPRPVDLITAHFDTLNHMVGCGDLLQAFCRIAESLRPGGHFYFDLVTPCRPLGGWRSMVRRACTTGGWLEQHVHWEPRRRLIRIRVLHRRAGACCPVVEHHMERAFAPDDVSRRLHQAGFTIRAVHDAGTLQPAESCPPRIIVIAIKETKGTRHVRPH